MSYLYRRRPHLFRRLIKTLGPHGVLVWGISVSVILSLTSGVVNALTGLDGTLLLSTSVVALTVSWVLALFPLSTWVGAFVSLAVGLGYLVVRVGRLLPSLMVIWRAWVEVALQLLRWYWTAELPELPPLAQFYLDFWRDMGVVLGRTVSWLASLVAGRGAFDVVGSAMVWGLVVWFYSAWAGWVIARHHKPLIGILPGALLLSFAISYTRSNPYVLLPVLGLTLLLMALTGQQHREHRWARWGIDFSQGLWGELAMAATGLAIGLVIVSAIAPSVTVEKIADWVRDVTDRGQETRTEQIAEGLGLEQKPEPEPRPVSPVEEIRVTGLPQSHLIGAGPELRRLIVMVIRTGELQPGLPEDPMMFTAPRHYWRAITYDYYFGRGWATSYTESKRYEPGAVIQQPEGAHLHPLRQEVRLVSDRLGGLIHVDGQLVSVDQPSEIAWRWPDEIFAATTEARQYRADSVYTVVTAEELRGAPTEYPEWMPGRYLQLPDDLPPRVMTLARDLTATEPTPYDRALAIERYLRQFPYTTDVEQPPPGEDIADFFLFELQEGYCDYYATAMVVLARAAGLPARLVVGYASGSYDVLNARYIVTEADAHAWPEIYFPGYGWIEFEPTAGRPPFNRDVEETDFIWPDREPLTPLVPPEERKGPPASWIVGRTLLLGLAGSVGVVIVATSADLIVLLSSSSERMMQRLRQRLQRHARQLGLWAEPGMTVEELTEQLAERVEAIAQAHGFSGIEFLEPAMDEIHRLAELYVQVWYTPTATLTREERWEAGWLWWRLRLRLWLARLWRRAVTEEPA